MQTPTKASEPLPVLGNASTTPLSSGTINDHTLSIELVEPGNHVPAAVVIGWPDRPTVIPPAALDATVAAATRVLSNSVIELAALKVWKNQWSAQPDAMSVIGSWRPALTPPSARVCRLTRSHPRGRRSVSASRHLPPSAWGRRRGRRTRPRCCLCEPARRPCGLERLWCLGARCRRTG